MNLFQTGNFKLASGQTSNFKIECDALTDEDWKTFAFLISKKIKFSKVIGVPRGGLKLAKFLEAFEINDVTLPRLVVDDVYTTGGSIRKIMKENDIGFVIFARNVIDDPKVKALFTVDEKT